MRWQTEAYKSEPLRILFEGSEFTGWAVVLCHRETNPANTIDYDLWYTFEIYEWHDPKQPRFKSRNHDTKSSAREAAETWLEDHRAS
jgi:hypothetical protein